MAVAPTTQIETVLIVRPLKVTAFVCGIVAIVLLTVSIAATSWLETTETRLGLWGNCVRVGEEINCNNDIQLNWILACGILCIVGLVVCLIATIINGVGLGTKDVVYKFKYYRVAMYFMFLAAVSLIVALIVFPVMFLEEREVRINTKWYFGWGYGVSWGATVFMLGAAILLLIDKESEEIFYREKTYYNSPDDEA